MSTRPDKWMVIHDASRDDGLKAIILAFESLPIKSGDELTLLGVINLHPSPRVGSNNKSKEDEHVRKEEYLKREEVIQLSDICANKKIIFQIDVQATSSPKTVAALAAKVLMVNWVVLDRQMKKYKKYFMDKLTCGILRMKRDNTIEKLRGPIIREDKNLQSGKRTKSSEHVSYGEMIPVMSKQAVAQIKTLSPQKATNLLRQEGDKSSSPPSVSISSTSTFNTSDISSSTDASNSFHRQENDHRKKQSPTFIHEHKYQTDVKVVNKQENHHQEAKEFEYSECSVCQNKRPSIQLKRDFSYADLLQATNGFSSDNFLSEGGFGSVYKGKLKCGLRVAVKQRKDASFQGEKEFTSEVNVLSKARHPNLVVLLGSCSEGTHRLLVYEFVCYGSLDQHLSSPDLTWDKRIKIALGAARGDFGLARTDCIDTDETGVVGTLGYVAPEYAECGKVSFKTDVYSFGVVLLQLLTGCKTKETKFDGKTLVEWARPLLGDKNYPVLIDEKILESHDLHVFQLYLMVQLAERCLNKNPTKRETMEDVAEELDCIKRGTTRDRDLRRC
ncbi:concanavalin A-like lectin/glucanase [Tanacetum coccineum]